MKHPCFIHAQKNELVETDVWLGIINTTTGEERTIYCCKDCMKSGAPLKREFVDSLFADNGGDNDR
jgi:hypothetical protein